MTIYFFIGRSVKIALTVEQLSDQHGTACGTAKGVVGQADELVIKEAVLAQSAEGHAHAAVDITVQSGLRTVVFLKVGDVCK